MPLPEVLAGAVDNYIDSLGPQIQPRIASEIDQFQQKTIDSLEDQIVDAFRSLFNKDGDSGKRSFSDSVPDSYGSLSLPFADEIAGLTRNFSSIAGEAGDDLREIFNLTEGNGAGTRSGGSPPRTRGGGGTDAGDIARGFFSAAVQAVQTFSDDRRGSGGGGGGLQLDGVLGVLSNALKDAGKNPEEKARLITPEIKEKLASKLRQQHGPIAEQFTRIALDHLKRWLRGNTSARDLGDGAKGEIEDQVKDLVKGLGGLFGGRKDQDRPPSQGGTRSLGGEGSRDGPGEGGDSGGLGFSKLVSEKLTTGLAKVHREVRIEFRKILGKIEKELFELLPDEIQKPLEKILGGNPFDSELDRPGTRGSTDRGIGDDLKAKLVSKIRDLVRKVQETLRNSILGVVNGGHRKLERESWMFVHTIVEQKVQKYLPKVKISVPDDIGNEGVSVGAPTHNVQLGGGHQDVPPVQRPPSGGHGQAYSYAAPPQGSGQGYNFGQNPRY
ncbi:hypothetical protein VTJ04DRAFT_7318 [Mycothermus thermophilus]|uniref:uncharacterized protein n=1 Tax=Humicola insolens TaxID=85995 RepID=UPI00374373A1